ncbi:hypothetical protein PHSY_003282 [Pseudozyma hubeiensis SY62]|uniref:Uncharacterized protein n=1 Tax=Pseudozyma hubeiensis (strain SY62) TaxID=1305764 RepID=R9P2Y4_PSEHS|nr:hypothetical protein PHSY_003282 [Pseudozyma hubeiensis SY62]GAC95706.1 hypothetical protein PHSY_003282 [Pseudozyma hubeiensis SY62]
MAAGDFLREKTGKPQMKSFLPPVYGFCDGLSRTVDSHFCRAQMNPAIRPFEQNQQANTKRLRNHWGITDD